MKQRCEENAQHKTTMPLSFLQQCAYAMPVMPLLFLFGPLGIIQGIYAKYFGLGLGSIATVLLISRLFDAISDPLIGYFSDRHYNRTGSRKAFVVGGGLLFIISSYFLYVPSGTAVADGSVQVSTIYFLVWFLMFYLGWTLLEIPHLAWGADIAITSSDRNRIYSLRTGATSLGILLFYAVPFLPFFPSQEFTPQTLEWAALFAGLLMLIALYGCVKLTPNGTRLHTANAEKIDFRTLRREIMANKPFLCFLFALSLWGVASGMWFSLMFIFVDSYLQLGNNFALLTLIALSICLVSLGFWCLLADRLGKKATWAIGAFLYMIGLINVGLLDPGSDSILGLSIAIVLFYVGTTPIVANSPSLLSDIIDYSNWKFRSTNTATYFSIYTLLLKGALAIGGAIGLGIASSYAFDPTLSVHSLDAIFGLRLAGCWLPATLIIFVILVMLLSPINARRHQIIRRRLNSREKRQSKSIVLDNALSAQY